MAVADGTKIQAYSTLEVTVCTCGVKFAVPERLIENCRNNGADLYCPNGHCLSWQTTEAQRLRKELENEKNRRATIAADRDRQRARADETEQRRIAQKAATTRAKRRHGNAVCPACNRSFVQLRRHMASQHPDFDPETA